MRQCSRFRTFRSSISRLMERHISHRRMRRMSAITSRAPFRSPHGVGAARRSTDADAVRSPPRCSAIHTLRRRPRSALRHHRDRREDRCSDLVDRCHPRSDGTPCIAHAFVRSASSDPRRAAKEHTGHATVSVLSHATVSDQVEPTSIPGERTVDVASTGVEPAAEMLRAGEVSRGQR